MKAFAALYAELDATTRTGDKVAALAAYFRAAPPADAAWALALLTGKRPKRTVGAARLREWIGRIAGLPAWLVDECHDHVGDLAETASLLASGDGGLDESLATVVERRVVALAALDDAGREEVVTGTWAALTPAACLVYTKLITGGFRVGVATGLVLRAVAAAAGAPVETVANRLAGAWEPTADTWLRATAAEHPTEGADGDPGRPYPFALAHPWNGSVDLGPIADWQVEWKWDGIRAQLIRPVDGQPRLWSRGQEDVGAAFPDVLALARDLPPGTVLDGELLAWTGEAPLPFARLQKRLGRTKPSATIQAAHPCTFLAYDCLALAGEDRRAKSTAERRQLLESLPLRRSPLVLAADWDEARALRATARERGVEGLMLKRRDAPYPRGRITGQWWKWKIDPHTLDTVLLYAQAGHGRRAGLHTDYTLGVWTAPPGDETRALVPIAKAYSGLTDAELLEMDRWIRAHTRERFGPVRHVEPLHVFELAFEGVQASPRHKSGIALRFPRIARWRKDKPAAEADTLAGASALLATT